LLIDLHAAPGDRSPEAFAAAVTAAGLDAVVITDRNRIDRSDAYVEALTKVGVRAYVGVEFGLEAGTLVLVPTDPDDAAFRDGTWKPTGAAWSIPDALEAAAAVDGVLIAGHPYCRDLGRVLGDRVYRVKGVAGVETRVGRGQLSWDNLAEHAARKADAAQLGSSGGDPNALGAAGTVFPGEAGTQSALVDSIRDGLCLAIEMDDPASPRDRTPPEPPPRRESRDDRDGRDRDRGGRGGRDGGGRGRR
jgi:hypothetical protein